MVTILHLSLHKTKIGVAMRASSENPTLAYARGVNVMFVQSIVWLIGGALAGIAGGFWSVYSQATPEMGVLVLLRAFAASCIGGFTSYYGTIAGGYIIGSAECILTEALYFYFKVDVAYKPIISYIILVVVLLIRPTGLMGISVSKRLNLWEKIKNYLGKDGVNE
jgi:branched-chain amino acid transport system permease protein